jgi:hypothetical protein
MNYIECNNKMPTENLFVDIIVASRLNPYYQTRKCDVACIDGDFKVQLLDIEYVSHWMYIPKLPEAKFYDFVKDI